MGELFVLVLGAILFLLGAMSGTGFYLAWHRRRITRSTEVTGSYE